MKIPLRSIHLLLLACLLSSAQAAPQPAKLLSAIAQPAPSSNQSSQKEVWMMPPGPGPSEPPSTVAMRDFLLHPDDWKQTRAAMTARSVGVFGSSLYKMNKAFSPGEMRQFGGMLNDWNIKFALEIVSVAGPRHQKTAQAAFDQQSKGWDALQANGLPIYSFAMDGPWCREVFDQHLSQDDAAQDTADFIALVRKHYPDARIGDIEPYPAYTCEQFASWIKDLQAKLAAMHVRGIDFFRLDCNWTHFMLGDQGSWRGVKQIEVACHRCGVPFSLIYDAPAYDYYKRMGIADDSVWHTFVMYQGYAYALVNGSPDQYVLESWIGTPSTGTPESNPDSFSRSVLDFCNKFVLKPIPPSGL